MHNDRTTQQKENINKSGRGRKKLSYKPPRKKQERNECMIMSLEEYTEKDIKT